MVTTTGTSTHAQKYPAVTPEPETEPAEPPPPTRSDDDDDDDDGGGGGAEELLTPATKPWFFTGGVGPTFFDLTRGDGGPGPGGPGGPGGRGRHGRFRVGLDIGYHFSGDFTGPAIGLAIEQSFDDALYVFNPAFKFWWDIQIIDEYAIYVAPFGKAGYALGAATGGPGHAFDLGVGAEGRVVFNDFAMAFLRPVQLDFFLGDFFGETFVLSYSLLIGGGLTF